MDIWETLFAGGCAIAFGWLLYVLNRKSDKAPDSRGLCRFLQRLTVEPEHLDELEQTEYEALREARRLRLVKEHADWNVVTITDRGRAYLANPPHEQPTSAPAHR